MIEIVHWEGKWYACNNRRLWCFREAAVIAVQVRVGSTDRAFLPVVCVQGVRRGVCQPHRASQPRQRRRGCASSRRSLRRLTTKSRCQPNRRVPMSREIHSGRHSPDAKRLRLIPPRRQRLLLLRREHRHPRALRPVPSSQDHLQVPRAFPLRRYKPGAWARPLSSRCVFPRQPCGSRVLTATTSGSRGTGVRHQGVAWNVVCGEGPGRMRVEWWGRGAWSQMVTARSCCLGRVVWMAAQASRMAVGGWSESLKRSV